MTDRYAVIGNPISQSKSPIIHTAFAESTGHDLRYGTIMGEPGGFARALEIFQASGGKGMNVTAPFKLDAFESATDRHARAVSAGAANCLSFRGDRIEADNFDGVGLYRDITVNLGISVAGKRVLVLGAGGATRGAIEPLNDARPASILIANRTASKAHGLAATFGVAGCGLDDLEGRGPFDIVINATSAGLLAQEFTLPAGLFAPDSLAYDMTYGKGLTAFLRDARHDGAAKLHDGVGMLVEQAAEAFAWWRGVRPDTRPVIARLTVPLT